MLKPGAHSVRPTPGPSSLLTTQHPVLTGSRWGVGEKPGPITVPSPTPSRSSVIDSQAATLPVCALALHCRPACRFCTASSAHKHRVGTDLEPPKPSGGCAVTPTLKMREGLERPACRAPRGWAAHPQSW